MAKVETLPSNLWDVISMDEFLHYKCPACVYFCKDENQFIDHAYDHHKESVVYICRLTSTNELGQNDHDTFIEDDEFQWDADCIDTKENTILSPNKLSGLQDNCSQSNQPLVECKVEESNDDDEDKLQVESIEPVNHTKSKTGEKISVSRVLIFSIFQSEELILENILRIWCGKSARKC